MRLTPALARTLARRGERIVALDRLLESYSYHNVLERGFALVTDEHQQIVTDAASVRPGQPLSIQVATGNFGATAGQGAAPPRRRSKTKVMEGQGSLF